MNPDDQAPAPSDDPAEQARISGNLTRMKAAGATDDELETYLRDIEHLGTGGQVPTGGTDWHALYRSGALAKQMARKNANEQDMAAAQTPGYAESALGGVAALARQIPGAEAAQAGARSVIRGQPYTTALQDIRGAEDDNPVSGANGLLGGVLAGAAIPGGAALSGARYGLLNGLLSADPESMQDRAGNALLGAGVGAAAGKAGEMVGTGVRALVATPLGAKALAMKAAMKTADDAAYGLAGREAAQNATSPAIRDALELPTVKPYADVIRNSPVHAGATDATVLQEAYKLMSEHQGKLQNAMANATDFKAGTSLGAAETAMGKQQLLSAAETPWSKTETVPPITTAQSPAPSIRDAIGNFWDRIGLAHSRVDGTVEQQMARTALERHGAENVVSPGLLGAPGPQTITTDMPAALPSLRAAIEQHASMAGDLDSFNAAADATKRIAKGTQVAGKKLTQNSPEAFAASIQQMTPSQAQAAIDGLLGRLRGQVKVLHPFNTTAQLSRMGPYLSLLDQRAGNQFPGLLSTITAAKGVGLLGP